MHAIVGGALTALGVLVGAAGSHVAPRQHQESPATPDVAALGPRELLLALTRAPRLPGSPAERAAADLCRDVLTAAGLEVVESRHPIRVLQPVRQDLQVFTGPNELLAKRERFEAFDWAATPTWPVPPTYRNTPTADVRAPVVDAGAGAAADYERLAAQRIDVAGAIVLVRSSAPPAALAREAETHGARGLLVCAPRRAEGPAWPEGPWASDRQLAGGEVHVGCTIPAAPIRPDEAAAITALLRARRVRGADGATVTLQVGPGPVEVRLALDVPAHETEQLALVARTPGADPAAEVALHAPLATFGADGLAAAETVTALLVARDPARPPQLAVVFGGPPAASVLQRVTDTLETPPERGRELGALLAYTTDLAATDANGFILVDRFLDPDQARLRAVARAIVGGAGAGADSLEAALLGLPWVAALRTRAAGGG